MVFHENMENYLKAKKSFVDTLPRNAFAITNLDDKNGPVMVQNCRADIKNYSTRTISDYKARLIETHLDGMILEFNNREFNTMLTGRFNISNLLAIFGAAVELGKDPEEVLCVMSTLKPVSGRFETIRSGEGVTAIVDYAHTPDAIKNVLGTVKDVLRGNGNIITVIGAGGNRDKGKRPIMAVEAVKNSHKVILTSDNPRNEEPQDIINDMLAGLSDEQKKSVLSIADRKEAIRTACALAGKGDVVVVAGKGHEDYQEIKGVKHHFDDKEVIREIFNI
jgi:UDP-N-acetylmuramoyl-L-alanyl-D-glutamate--2,6-diaminopimelate ligase